MSAIPIGSLAIQLVGGGGLGGAVASGGVAGVTAAVVTKILDMISAAARQIIKLIQSAIRKIFSEGRRLAMFAPTAAMAAMTTQVGQLLRDISRARALGPSFLRLARVTNSLRNQLEPIIQALLKIGTGSLVKVLTLIDEVAPAILKLVDTIFLGTSVLLGVIASIARARNWFDSSSPVGPGMFTYKGRRRGMSDIPDLLADAANELERIRQAMQGAIDDGQVKSVNGVFMNDLRSLTEGATRFGRDQSELLGPGGRDLFKTGP